VVILEEYFLNTDAYHDLDADETRNTCLNAYSISQIEQMHAEDSTLNAVQRK